MKKYIFLLVLLFCTNVIAFTASDFSSAKRNLSNAQKELTQVANKRDKLQQKQQQLQADYEETLAQIEAHKEKPKSLPYKNAVKKSESLNANIEQNNSELNVLNQQIETLNRTIAEYEAELQSAQQVEAQQANEDVVEEPQNEDRAEVVEEKPAIEHNESVVISKGNQSTETADSSLENQSDKKVSDEDYTMVYIGIFVLFILYIIYKIIKWVRWHKCPKCKKKWAMKVIDEQDCGIVKKEKVKKQDGTHEWVYYHKIKVTRECKHCGYQVWHTEVRKEA